MTGHPAAGQVGDRTVASASSPKSDQGVLTRYNPSQPREHRFARFNITLLRSSCIDALLYNVDAVYQGIYLERMKYLYRPAQIIRAVNPHNRNATPSKPASTVVPPQVIG
jgi:hypothetical protein